MIDHVFKQGANQSFPFSRRRLDKQPLLRRARHVNSEVSGNRCETLGQLIGDIGDGNWLRRLVRNAGSELG
ncbi:hypothetical protein GCM10025858_10890 [Alicyclobacillus sacchari]|nr:hypothetical protein GCM10025858_10890 [Alicyclobacillus sacchari]